MSPQADQLESVSRPRRIRSFVRREGRLTPGQQQALEQLWPVYGLDPAATTDLDAAFGSHAPVTLEIGFGNGEALAAMAEAAADQHFLGIEVHRPGVGRLLRTLDDRGIGNVRVCSDDAVDILRQYIPAGALARILLFFPDPWPKKKHHKRRILQPEFVSLAAQALADGGVLHMATDWVPYAEQMLDVVQASPDFRNAAAGGGYSPRPAYRPLTKFERRGQRLGHEVRDLIFVRAGRQAGEVPAAPG